MKTCKPCATDYPEGTADGRCEDCNAPLTDKATSPYLNRPLRSETEARGQHTPGPWTAAKGPKIRDGVHIRANGRYVANISHFKNYETGEIADEAMANACLIVAAPDLLTAARAVAEAWNGDGTMASAVNVVLLAIAKATPPVPDAYSARDKVREEIANNPEQWS